ncbi:MAG: PKD domain-containing protein [Bacteroidetes bacterium]|nr:PKD domain-containing protein [Bacteroidota bacterium]
MRHFRNLLLVTFLLSGLGVGAQDFSNKGKEFWIPYSYHVGAGGAGLVMTLYITSDVATTYQVAIHGGVTIQSGSLTAGQVVTCIVPNTYFIPNEGLYSGKAIVVTSDKGVVVYSYITQSAVSGATVCLPTNVLGREYYSMNFTQVSNAANSNSYFTIIAAEDNTSVEITPTANTKNGWVAGTTYTINLNKGQIYQVLGTHNNTPTGGLYTGVDLTGSKIKSVTSGQNPCKRIAVFSGAGKIRIGTNCGTNNSSDNLYQQLYPQATWGKSYLTVPSFSRPNNFYRVIRSTSSTNVYVNGTLVPSGSFINGYYEFSNGTPNYITSDEPISVAQYFTTQGCSSNATPYDPDMIVLNPIEQNISKVTLVSSNLVATANRQHHMHVIMRSGGTGISSFRFDGAVIPSTASWVPHPALTGYSYLYLSNVTAGYHTLSSDSGFNALAYGYAAAESYGYSAGANVKDLYQYISIQNQFATVNFPATCRNTPFFFSMTFPYQPTQIQWIFGSALNGQGISDITLPNPTPTGTVVVNGRTLYIYKLPNPYTISTAGTYQIKVLATNPSPDGCTGLQEINFDLDVQPTPIANFTLSNVCDGNPVQFTDASSTNSRPISTYYWDFGDNTTGSTLNPSHLYPGPATYNPRYSIITDIGCISDTITKSVTVFPKPTATLVGTVGLCQGAPEPQITFTGANGTPPYTFTYTLNGGPAQQIVTTTGNSVSINVPTATVGIYTYSLTNVKDASSLACEQAQTGSAVVTVFAKPTGATITGSTAVCLNGTAPTLTLTGQGGSGNYLFTYNLNGGPDQTLSSTGGAATITVPTNAVGTFTYNLTSVEDPSNVLCRTNINTSATVTVNPLPTASITGTLSVCQNATQPNITFTGAGGTAPYTFVYTLNGGSSQQVISGANGIATVSVPTATPGTFTYSLQSVTDATASLCTQLQSGNAIVTVNPLPTASISGATVVCQNATAPTVTFTGADGTAPYTFAYSINGGATQTVTTTTGNSVTVSVPTTTPGSFAYNLISVTDASSTTCLQNQTGTAIITVNPLPTASIAGTTNVCLNATSPFITFTGAVGTAPYTFAFNINGGTTQTVTTTTGNSVTVSVPTATAGTFTYNLISVTDASSTVCTQNQSGSATVVVYPLPTATFSSLTPRCETGIISFTDQSVANAGNVTGWSWNFGDPISGANNTSTLQNPQHVFATAGTYSVTLTVTTNNGCVSVNPAIPVVIHSKPLAGFINPEVCLIDTYAQFTDTSSVASPSAVNNWNWDFGDPTSGANNTSSLQNPQHSYLALGSYPVVLIVTSNQGCKDTVNQTLIVNGSFPVSNFSINNTNNLCANDSISITNLSTVLPGVITKVEIFWDDVAQPTVVEIDQNPTPGKVYKHKYPNFQSPLSKTYNIRYRSYSGGVCSNDKVLPITINAAPKVQFNPIPNICLDAPPYQITQASEIGGVPGSLLFTGPGISSTGLFNPSTAGAGTHTIRYYFTSTAGGCIDSATQTIKVWIPPVADFTVSSPVCERQSVTFTNTSTSTEGTLTQWRWDFGDGTPVLVRPNGNPVQHTYATFGTFVVKLNVVTSNGCVSVAKTVNLDVKPLARPNFSFPAVSCLPNANIQFTNLSSIPDGTQSSFTYLWNFGDPVSGPVNTSTAMNPAHIYTALGPYSVNLQVTTGAGCIRDTMLVLNTLHPQPIASFTTDKIDVCIGGAIQFNSTSNGADGTITQWFWDLDNGTTRNQPNFSYTYSAIGNYNVSHYIVNSFNCRSTTATTSVSVNPYPVADAGPDKLMLEGGQTQLTPVNNNTMPITIRWRPSSYLSDPTILSPIARPIDDIYYTLYLITDKGCAAQDVVFVKVLKTPIVPNIFSPNGDGVHDTWVIPYLDSYPGCTVEVVNRYGQLVFRSVGYPTPWDGRINGNPAPVGTYYFVIDPKNGRKRVAGYVDIIR